MREDVKNYKQSKGKEKKAEAEEKPEHPATTLGKSVAGLGTGMTAGYLGMKGVDEALKLKQLKAGVPKGQLKGVGGAAKWAIPASTAVLGMATPYFYQATVDKMRDNFKKRREGGPSEQKTAAAEMKQDNFEGLVRPKRVKSEEEKKFIALAKKRGSQ